MLDKKIIIVIGGKGLLGEEFVKIITQYGATPIVADFKINDNIEEKSSNVLAINLDITSTASIEKLIKIVHDKFGKIDSIINCAYPKNNNFGNHFFDVSYEDFCENTNTHLGGYFLINQKFCKYFINQGYGNIVNFSSIYGVVPPRFEIYDGTEMTSPIEYGVTKSSIIYMTKYVARYLKGKNIRINCISPGGIFDNQNSKFLIAYKSKCLNKGMLDKSDINGALLFLLSDLSHNMNGQNIIVDDGFSL